MISLHCTQVWSLYHNIPVYISMQVVEGNPCLEYIKYITFPWFNQFEVQRSEANGGGKVYTTIDELTSDYASGALHPSVCARMH